MSDLKLTDREWADFYIKDIFQTYKGQKGLQTHTGAYVSKHLLSSGIMPRITVKDTLNGIDSFCYSTDKNFRFFKNFISVSFLGSVFYHSYEASLDMKVHALIPLEIELNSYTAKFLISAIKNSITLLSYGNQLSSTDLPKMKILLPINSDGLPDWRFMEDFIKQKEQKQIADLKDYYANKAVELMISTGSLKNTRWKSFFIGGKEGIFQIRATKSGIDKNKLKVSENGKTPYITRSDMDNGINLFVSDEQMPKYKKDDGNVITIGLDTQTVFYQKNSFWTGQNIQVLSNDNLNYWVAMFVIPLLKIQMKKFAWGSTGATLGRLNRTHIMLPVNSDGSPDWRFMEDFMKQIERDKIAAVLNYYNNSLNNNNLRRW